MAQDIIHNSNFNVTNEYSFIIVDGYIIGITPFGYSNNNQNLNDFINNYIEYQNDGNMPDINESEDYKGYSYIDCNIDYAIGLNQESMMNDSNFGKPSSIDNLYNGGDDSGTIK